MQSDENMRNVKKIGRNNVVINMIIGTGDRNSLRVFIKSLSELHNMVKTWENRGVDFEKGNEVAYKCRKKKVRKNFEIRTIDFLADNNYN